MNKFYTLIFVAFILLNCNQDVNDFQLPSQAIQLNQDQVTQEKTASVNGITLPIIITIFADDLDYNKHEKTNSKQEYYNLADFQGYYAQLVVPFIKEKNIQVINIKSRDTVLSFKIGNGDVFSFNLIHQNYKQYKQGLILFNGKMKPVFWNGKNAEGQLHDFLVQYYKL